MKFKATITIPGEPGNIVSFETDHGNLDSECLALYEWLTVHKGSLGSTNSMHTLHLFHGASDDIAICGTGTVVWGSRPLHFATSGKKYKVCLKCRKIAEGGE
tara:strand:- start:152 stop:457 length:306 start_codon:yes stop_codon:yes gene_type:complete